MCRVANGFFIKISLQMRHFQIFLYFRGGVCSLCSIIFRSFFMICRSVIFSKFEIMIWGHSDLWVIEIIEPYRILKKIRNNHENLIVFIPNITEFFFYRSDKYFIACNMLQLELDLKLAKKMAGSTISTSFFKKSNKLWRPGFYREPTDRPPGFIQTTMWFLMAQ